MFYGAFVLAKKGPLAKVWLAAHWDKKLTKAHIFETDVESTVDNIISPKVKMALRTSGHLLLGVVRIYSRKQKYLIHDLGEACAKIRMAFRPGIVDLPAEGGVANPDAITLPEIFHDFETAVADLGSLQMEDQFTINPSRASEITMAEDLTTTGGDMFGELEEFDLTGGGFGGGMEDIEVARKDATLLDEKDQTNGELTKIGDNTTMRSEKDKANFTMEDQLPDRGDFGGEDFLQDGFGGGMMDLDNLGGPGEVPNISDITLERDQQGDKEGEQGERDKETPMEVDQAPTDQPTVDAGDPDQTVRGPDMTVIPLEGEGFILEPVDVSTVTKERRGKRKRKLVVDNSKELTADDIRAQLNDCSDIVQQKCFPPPTKKALAWKTMASSEQLFQKPGLPLAPELIKVITRNYSTNIPGLPVDEDLDLNLDQEEPRNADVSGMPVDTTANLEAGDEISAVAPPTTEQPSLVDDTRLLDLEMGGNDDLLDLPEDAASRVIPEMPDLEAEEEPTATQSTEERHSNELTEEFEQRRWTKRTQQVFRILNRNLSNKKDVPFSSLTQRCSRKQAASRFYTCLLLTKDGTIDVEQSEAYGPIQISKGPRFAEAV